MCIRRRSKTIRCSALHKQDYAAREEVVPQTRAGLLPSISLNGSTAYNRARVSQRPVHRHRSREPELRTTARHHGPGLQHPRLAGAAGAADPRRRRLLHLQERAGVEGAGQAGLRRVRTESDRAHRRRVPRRAAQPGRARIDERRRSRREAPAGTGAAALRRRPRRHYGCVGRNRRLRQRRGAPHPGRTRSGHPVRNAVHAHR